MRRPQSLVARLVVTALALVVAVSALIGAAATAAMHSRLIEQVDDQVHDTAEQIVRDQRLDPGNLEPGTIVVQLPDGREPFGEMYGRGRDNNDSLDDQVLSAIAALDLDGRGDRVRGADLPRIGDYRLQAIELRDGTVVVGQPTDDVGEAVASLIGYQAVFIALGGLLAAVVGVIVVRRQLRPLREVAATAERVAELPLSTGEIVLTERVAEHLTDARTEVGQVGASLNTLLAHVEASLAARHRSEQQVRQFVADASHELRTPLTTIKGYAELARRRPDDTAMAHTALAKVDAESARMTSLVEDLLLLARLDAGRGLARERVDLSRLMIEAVSDARVLAPGHSWRLELPQTTLEVLGDEQRLHQLLTNLLTNARKHTPGGTTVTVAAGVRPGQPGGVWLTVHDDGPGFPEELVPQAFERFVRADESRTRGAEATGGAGLGLALVQAIVTGHGGTVSLNSSPGDTTVTVHLPS